MEHDVFISYSSQDKVAADAICHILEENEVRCWIAPRDIPAGAEYGDLIDEAIKHCRIVVVLYSQTAATSLWVKGEMNIAFEEGKIIIPFRLDPTPLTGQSRVILNQRHWIDAYPDYQTKFTELVDAVLNAIGRNRVKENHSCSSENTRKRLWNRERLIYCIGGIFIVSLLAFFLPRLIRSLNGYQYDREGLHVSVKGLTEEQEEALTSILDRMRLIEGGTFVMGNNINHIDFFTEQDSLSAHPHYVTLGNFYIGQYEVTQREWKAFLSLDGRCIEEGEAEQAMDMLSWEDAALFADTLAKITGLKFALPTEAQWEYAAKGGKRNRNYVFSGHSDDPTEVGWTSADGLNAAHKVGGKRYNELELYDMTGNVSEWCQDYFAPYLPDSVTDPKGPETGLNRVLRGGDFRTPNLFDLKTTTRYSAAPFVNRKATGLRLVINI